MADEDPPKTPESAPDAVAPAPEEEGKARVIDFQSFKDAKKRRAAPPMAQIPGPLGDAVRDAMARGLVKKGNDGAMRLDLDGDFLKDHGPKLIQGAISAFIGALGKKRSGPAPNVTVSSVEISGAEVTGSGRDESDAAATASDESAAAAVATGPSSEPTEALATIVAFPVPDGGTDAETGAEDGDENAPV